MFFDPSYILRAEVWLEKANNIKDISNDQLYCKFFFLWTSFNALYNLKGSADKILEILEDKDVQIILEKTQESYLSLKNDFIINMYRKNSGNISRSFVNDEGEKGNTNYSVEELKKIINKIRIIRNNLTHGNKEGIQRDEHLLKISMPILEETIVLLLEKCKSTE